MQIHSILGSRAYEPGRPASLATPPLADASSARIRHAHAITCDRGCETAPTLPDPTGVGETVSSDLCSSHGEVSVVNSRVLVAYASEDGSTAGVAEALAKQLVAGGLVVDVRQAGDVTDISSYTAVVVGSAIHGGKWLPGALTFVETHQNHLRQIPTAYFQVNMMMARNTEQDRKLAAGWLEPVRMLVKPVAEGMFAGACRPSKHRFFFKGLGLRIFLRTIGMAEGDYRDWNAISAWADATRPSLTA